MLPIFAEGLRRENRRQANLMLIRERRRTRLSSAPFNLPEQRFVELFRLSKRLARGLINRVAEYWQRPLVARGITCGMAVLTSLRFYATGSYQRSLGQDINFGLSQTSVHRCIHHVTNIIDEHLADEFISFPNTRQSRNENKVSFMEKFGFPGVIGAIDCTHIAILKPHIDEHNFINRKGYHSLNVQLIANAKMEILNVNANYGGSTNDSFIWRNSQIQAYLQNIHNNGEENSWLIGDSGYPLQPYLLVPILNALPGSPEDAYNIAHRRARNIIERTIGLLKMRFRCVLKERVARYSPEFVAKLVTVTAILHNMCIRAEIPLLGNDQPIVLDEEENINIVPHGGNRDLFQEGQRTRHNVILRYFTP